MDALTFWELFQKSCIFLTAEAIHEKSSQWIDQFPSSLEYSFSRNFSFHIESLLNLFVDDYVDHICFRIIDPASCCAASLSNSEVMQTLDNIDFHVCFSWEHVLLLGNWDGILIHTGFYLSHSQEVIRCRMTEEFQSEIDLYIIIRY